MGQLDAYKRQSLDAGWTRIELLLWLYDRAITAIEGCEIAFEADDSIAFAKQEIQARKVLLAIQSGIKPEESEVAFNITRLLHHVLFTFDNHRFEACKTILTSIRDGFAAIADQANEMERSGQIPPIASKDTFESLV
jgi:flagellin-specific chaperone FliS